MSKKQTIGGSAGRLKIGMIISCSTQAVFKVGTVIQDKRQDPGSELVTPPNEIESEKIGWYIYFIMSVAILYLFHEVFL